MPREEYLAAEVITKLSSDRASDMQLVMQPQWQRLGKGADSPWRVGKIGFHQPLESQ